ncbi:tetratricopeptide repeat domain protein [Aspergillus homomorphus CBS 101889]|uniref:Tetratricopeptide repeat domain protein n=1 Tax=Aspergillus homomorphus (strain CBS 101889) TaxID=1450537 RepID=A0A395HM85_ASPHC|nr:tetratricopeptide repeat domain protein [Aspergillus homomorphus CBS 101889]RAL08345.1 tetratricopeptide repeat domain protein [Aspergillus homomorphus CBS 101889]
MPLDYASYTNTTVHSNIIDPPVSQTDAKRQYEKEIILSNTTHGAPSRLFGTKTRILRASDVLLSLAGGSTSDAVDDSEPGVESFQEVLSLFPPFRDGDGATFGAVDIKCPDCDATFSSDNELKQHYLTKYCPGTAVAVYVMTRDRLITKGYRMEKRLIPLKCRPIRFFCDYCDQIFTFGEEDEKPERQPNAPIYVNCKHCGEKCNVSYQPILNDPRDDISPRDVQRERGNVHSRSPSLAQRPSMGSKFPVSPGTNLDQQSFTRKAKKLRDSWSFRKISPSDEDELIAISFAGLYDLERVHAPNGIYHPMESSNDSQLDQSAMSFASNGLNDASLTEAKRNLCEDEEQHTAIEDEMMNDTDDHKTKPASSRRESFLQRLFGRKVPKGVSRARSASNRGKKLIRKANTIRFSFVTKYTRSESRATGRTSKRDSIDAHTQESSEPKHESGTDAEYIALLQNSQNVFIHTQYINGGAVVHDASGRQRIIKIDEVAQVFLHMKEELSSANAWSRMLNTRMRAETALKQGNGRAAVVEYHDALKLLEDTPSLDTDKQSRATMLHALGQAYHGLDMTPESESCYFEALGLYKRTYGRDHPRNFALLHGLGALCEKDGYATEASALYERSFAGRLKTLGHNAPDTLSSMQDLASLKVLLGDLESALLLLEKAVPALETVFGLQNATTLNAMNQLSLLYQKLGLNKESRTICERTIPHCRSFFGIVSPITREAVVRFLQSSDNFDFPAEIKDILDHYQRSRDPDALRVVHRLGGSYMDAGLNRDAADLFEALVEDFLAAKGPEAPETFNALSALCVSWEHLDSVDKAILAYKQLVHMASRTSEDHHSRKRIRYAEKRISELNRRRETLAAERKEWCLHEPAACENCGISTTVLCNTCKIFRFCSDPCHKSGINTHLALCIPSVSLRESKSLAVKPKCPVSTRDQALSKIRNLDSTKPVNIITSYTFYLDPRNFTTFRMKLNSRSNTIILFSLDSDIRYTILDALPPSQHSPNPGNTAPLSSKSTGVNWISPERQDSIIYVPPSESNINNHKEARYVFITPGKEMLRSVIDKRVRVRGGSGEKERFQALDLPNHELIEYAQGLLLTGYLGEAFMYVIEWV